MGYRVLGGGSGGAGGGDQFVSFAEFTGPASYSTGGMVIDLSATYAQLNELSLAVKTVGANLPVAHYEFALNSPSAGKATVKIMRHRYDRVSSIGNAQNQPSGVSIASASGQTASSEAAHTHGINHDHASFASATVGGGADNVLLDALGPTNTADHTHTLDIPNFTGTSGAGSSHNHEDNSIYQHQHGGAHAETNAASVELAASTNLSGTVWHVLAIGVPA